MAKSDDNTTGIKSISKSARTKGAREAKKAKLGLIAGSTHGGICSGCGQKSNSCTPGSIHEACPGFYTGSFQNEVLDNLQAKALAGPEPGKKGAIRMQYDGTTINSDRKGRWMSELHILENRDRAVAAWNQQQKSRVIFTSRFEKAEGEDENGRYEYDKCVEVLACNGFDKPVEWLDGAWQEVFERGPTIESVAP